MSRALKVKEKIEKSTVANEAPKVPDGLTRLTVAHCMMVTTATDFRLVGRQSVDWARAFAKNAALLGSLSLSVYVGVTLAIVLKVSQAGATISRNMAYSSAIALASVPLIWLLNYFDARGKYSSRPERINGFAKSVLLCGVTFAVSAAFYDLLMRS